MRPGTAKLLPAGAGQRSRVCAQRVTNMAAFGRVLLRSRQKLCLRWSSSTVEAAKPVTASPDITDTLQEQTGSRKTTRFISPEFIIPRGMKADFPTKNHVERMDMLRRRSVMDIPGFYVGSILSVLTADPYALVNTRSLWASVSREEGTDWGPPSLSGTCSMNRV
ncbi:mitochondrial 54S ribosomal protein YmL19 [Branchiostoma belcheri]|nr:mitochondrial 54S ribosomal protein YmL19 [Branchiostoma belcheri]